MDWYYASGADQKGPVGDDELQRLAQQGVVTPETLVWREGLTSWQPHGGIAPQALAGAGSPGATVCAACGRKVPATEIFSLADAQYCAACKPEILRRISRGEPITSAAAEEMRKAHIKHEASVTSVGILYYLSGAGLFFIGLGVVIPSFAGKSSTESIAVTALIGLGFLAFSVGQICVGTGLRRLRKWARVPTGILSGFGLIGFPIGTLINAYILYLVFSQKGTTVFSDEYQAVIQQTPHIKYRTSAVVWIILGLVVLLIVAGIGVAVFKG